jgi:hypothetical protein
MCDLDVFGSNLTLFEPLDYQIINLLSKNSSPLFTLQLAVIFDLQYNLISNFLTNYSKDNLNFVVYC